MKSATVGRPPQQKHVLDIPQKPGPIGPFTCELGLKIRYPVPWAYALGVGYVVNCEPGEEALWPLALEHRIVPRVHDDTRRKGPGVRFPQKRFVPEPHVAQGIKADVVICPRLRKHGPTKNWPHWDALTELPGVFASGAPDSSYEVNVPRAWDYARYLDASIEAMRSARLCIATDAGLAHLAVLCGTPLLLITYRGLVAPGAVIDADGRVIQRAYWPVKWREYYESANHTGAHMEMLDGWEHPERVLQRARELMGA